MPTVDTATGGIGGSDARSLIAAYLSSRGLPATNENFSRALRENARMPGLIPGLANMETVGGDSGQRSGPPRKPQAKAPTDRDENRDYAASGKRPPVKESRTKDDATTGTTPNPSAASLMGGADGGGIGLGDLASMIIAGAPLLAAGGYGLHRAFRGDGTTPADPVADADRMGGTRRGRPVYDVPQDTLPQETRPQLEGPPQGLEAPAETPQLEAPAPRGGGGGAPVDDAAVIDVLRNERRGGLPSSLSGENDPFGRAISRAVQGNTDATGGWRQNLPPQAPEPPTLPPGTDTTQGPPVDASSERTVNRRPGWSNRWNAPTVAPDTGYSSDFAKLLRQLLRGVPR